MFQTVRKFMGQNILDLDMSIITPSKGEYYIYAPVYAFHETRGLLNREVKEIRTEHPMSVNSLQLKSFNFTLSNFYTIM